MSKTLLHLDADTSIKALLSSLISALDTLLSETNSEEWIGQIRWLNQWRK